MCLTVPEAELEEATRLAEPAEDPRPGVRGRERAIAHLPLGCAVALFLAFALGYNVLVPLGEAPDEAMHVRYVATLRDDHRLPDPDDTHQAQHPPLYYAVGAGVLTVLNLPDPLEPTVNQDFPAQPNAYVHNGEDFPYSRPVLSFHILRGISTAFGVAVVILTYLIADLILPGRRLLAFAAAATAALVPQFAFIAGSVNNDVPAAAFAAGATYSGLRALKSGESPWLMVSAVLLGAGMLVKILVGVSAIVPITAVAFSGQDLRAKLRWLAVIALVPLALAGWYYVRSLVLWGDLVVSADTPGGLPLPVGNPRGITDPVYRDHFLGAVLESYWYRGGYLNVGFTSIVYSVLTIFPIAAAAGVAFALRHGGFTRTTRLALCILAALPVGAFLTILQYSVTQDYAPQGRYLFVAQPAIAILLVLGISAVISREPGKDHPAVLVLPALLLLMNLWVFAVKLPGTY